MPDKFRMLLSPACKNRKREIVTFFKLLERSLFPKYVVETIASRSLLAVSKNSGNSRIGVREANSPA